jgi:hypothetical protein
LHVSIGYKPQTGEIPRDREVHIAFKLVTDVAALGGREASERSGFEHAKVRLGGDDPVYAGDRAGPIERALGAAHDLHPVDVGEPEIRVRGVVVDRCVIEIGADGRACSSCEGAV